MSDAATLRRTPFFAQCDELGAKLVPFAGWEMAVTFEGIREEHTAVRTHAGVFDVSHMGEVEVEGPGAVDFLQLALSNDVAKVEIGGAQYSCLCNEAGGVIDAWLVDTADASQVARIEAAGIRCRAVPLLMSDDDATADMVAAALDLAGV